MKLQLKSLNVSTTTPTGKDTALIDDVSFSVMGGALYGLLGPSGAGKSTLMKFIAGRRLQAKTNGAVYINGSKMTPQWRAKNISFMDQDTSLQPTATVREALTFSARFKSNFNDSEEMIREKVDSVLHSLALSHKADSIIGGEGVDRYCNIQGLSGGEKQRVVFAEHLLEESDIYVLDEPTSSLDSNAALNVIKLAKDISLKGKIMFLSIHQPSYRLFNQIDIIMLLSHGKLIHSGGHDNTKQFFGSFGYDIPINMCPAERYLELIENEDICLELIASAFDMEEEGRNEYSSHAPAFEDSDDDDEKKNLANKEEEEERKVGTFQEDSCHVKRVGCRSKLTTTTTTSTDITAPTTVVKYSSSTTRNHEGKKIDISKNNTKKDKMVVGEGPRWCVQFMHLARRKITDFWRNRLCLQAQLFNYIAAAVVIGSFYHSLREKLDLAKDPREHIGAIDVILIITAFAPGFNSIAKFESERKSVRRETSMRLYSLSAYFISLSMVWMIAEVTMGLVFASIYHPLAGLHQGTFWQFTAIIIMFMLVNESLGLLCAVISPSSLLALMLHTPPTVLMMLLGGNNITHKNPVINFTRYLNPFAYAMDYLAKIEMTGYIFKGKHHRSGIIWYKSGDRLLNAHLQTKQDFSSAFFSLFGIMIASRTLAFLAFIYIHDETKGVRDITTSYSTKCFNKLYSSWIAPFSFYCCYDRRRRASEFEEVHSRHRHQLLASNSEVEDSCNHLEEEEDDDDNDIENECGNVVSCIAPKRGHRTRSMNSDGEQKKESVQPPK